MLPACREENAHNLFKYIKCKSLLFHFQGFRSRDTTDGRNTNAFSVDICDVPNTSEHVTIEPLPDILSKVSAAPPLRPQITFVERGEHASTAPLISKLQQVTGHFSMLIHVQWD